MSVLLLLIILGVLTTLINGINAFYKIIRHRLFMGQGMGPGTKYIRHLSIFDRYIAYLVYSAYYIVPFSFAIAIYLGEYNPKGWLSDLLKKYS